MIKTSHEAEPWTAWTPEEARTAWACLSRDHSTRGQVAIGERFAIALIEKGPEDLLEALEQAGTDAVIDLVHLLDGAATSLRARLQNVEAVLDRIAALAEAKANSEGTA